MAIAPMFFLKVEWIFLLCLVVGMFTSSFVTSPVTTVIVSTQAPELKDMAMGFENVLVRVLGSIPGPVLFGALIDSALGIRWSFVIALWTGYGIGVIVFILVWRVLCNATEKPTEHFADVVVSASNPTTAIPTPKNKVGAGLTPHHSFSFKKLPGAEQVAFSPRRNLPRSYSSL
eukprot:TRINITY_DN65292_c0_g1_i1.p3 TRINITY_DN65292_c0_g1~~TRINITY_DN65292_c0_g1_i1.p3  ORF type:complete len:184 (-),score=21.36 TRINITY_DN65292_c0_g1_i1:1618-2139(-)